MKSVRGNRVPVFAAFTAFYIALGAATVFGAGQPVGDSIRPVAGMIESLWEAGRTFPVVDMFQQQGPALAAADAKSGVFYAQRQVLGEVLNDGVLLSFDASTARALISEAPETMTLALPAVGGRVELELGRVELFTPDFTVVTSGSQGNAVQYRPGVHYRGVVRNVPGSVAAISVFDREVIGMYSTPDAGDVVIGRLGGSNQENTHIAYAARDLKKPSTFSCSTRDDQVSIPLQDEGLLPMAAMATCVRIYVEADNDLYKNKGSVQNVTNYVTGFFNQSATLYQNESIPITMSQLYIWTTRSPYKGRTSSALLSQFQKYRTSFNGDLGHLVALRGGGGIAAGFSGFCNPTTSQRQCFSMVDTTYNNVPTYSWTVMVFTHEMGHLMGSRHTHACVWNGNNTAIDGCYSVEGTCPRPGIPPEGGTIMSYCHLQSVGTNFTLGFGPQPGGVIRTKYAGASCLVTCP